MCIVCDIKQAVEASGPNKEAREEIMRLVDKLAEGLTTALEVSQEVAEANPDAFSHEQRDRMQSAADLLNDRAEGLGGVLGLLPAALAGGASVQTVRVEVGEGESISDAIARTIAANEASSKAFTKH